ncbi:DUF3134 family protein [Chlorogloeopsis fritschii PCC 9212]|uniref:DUF3134 domain-containing protein n=1 Tax=Chlorogloeopsis fritschii PCC 6912 TaxID=211165 RepID=A0A3S0Y6G2_CHLFR|nr:DUF3134 family protein [Chlorogloeopsis fritschii]RUR86665.1 hypothetical protein PCC6912_01080 [Chlorogloeopsis fritschii PCC 6912]
MVKPSEPVLHEEPRNQRAAVIPLKHEESFLEWLRNRGRLISRGTEEYYDYDDEEEEELSSIMSNTTYDYEEQETEELDLEE